jgi:hypothetical protein
MDPDFRERLQREAEERAAAEKRAAEAEARKPRLIITLSATDDREITCVACGRAEVEFEFMSRARGGRSYLGIHARCAALTGRTENVG